MPDEKLMPTEGLDWTLPIQQRCGRKAVFLGMKTDPNGAEGVTVAVLNENGNWEAQRRWRDGLYYQDETGMDHTETPVDILQSPGAALGHRVYPSFGGVGLPDIDADLLQAAFERLKFPSVEATPCSQWLADFEAGQYVTLAYRALLAAQPRVTE